MATEVPKTVAEKAGKQIIQRLEREENKDLLGWLDAHMVRFAELLWERAPLEFDPKGTVLYDHTSENTAYVVENYPYGRDRTLMRYWMEYKKGKGYRFVSQTLNPKTKQWNKPSASTYSDALVMVKLDSNGHIVSLSPTSWLTAETIQKLRHYGQGYSQETLGEIRVGALGSFNYYANMLKYQKQTGLSGWAVNGVPQPIKEGDIERSREHMFDAALILALLKLNK
jgi:hypothetical protein